MLSAGGSQHSLRSLGAQEGFLLTAIGTELRVRYVQGRVHRPSCAFRCFVELKCVGQLTNLSEDIGLRPPLPLPLCRIIRCRCCEAPSVTDRTPCASISWAICDRNCAWVGGGRKQGGNDAAVPMRRRPINSSRRMPIVLGRAGIPDLALRLQSRAGYSVVEAPLPSSAFHLDFHLLDFSSGYNAKPFSYSSLCG